MSFREISPLGPSSAEGPVLSREAQSHKARSRDASQPDLRTFHGPGGLPAPNGAPALDAPNGAPSLDAPNGAPALDAPNGAPALSIRERARQTGVGVLSDVELLALLLGTGAVGQSASAVACALLGDVGSLQRIERVGVHRLAEQRGIGTVKATRLLAAIELGRRALLRSLSEERDVIGSFEAVAAWARPRLGGLDHEEVWLLCLDGKNGLRSARRIGQGGLHGCALRPADVLRPALEDAASGIVLVHNHPSGDPTPSVADIELTRALVTACEIVGIFLLDHVIVARSGAESLRELELFE